MLQQQTCALTVTDRPLAVPFFLCPHPLPWHPHHAPTPHAHTTRPHNTPTQQELWSAPGHPITAPLEYRHMYVDMTDIQVEATEFTHAGRTCPGAMGYSFAAGTTDGERQRSIQRQPSIHSSEWSHRLPEPC